MGASTSLSCLFAFRRTREFSLSRRRIVSETRNEISSVLSESWSCENNKADDVVHQAILRPFPTCIIAVTIIKSQEVPVERHRG
jgi:hypothetical protein